MPNRNTPQQIDFLTEVETSTDSIILKAAAGSGKTTTLIQAAQSLAGTPILALAFNKHSANELEKEMPEWVTCRTLNSIGHRAWGQFLSKRLQVNFDKVAKLVNQWMDAEGMKGKSEWTSINKIVNTARTHGLLPTGTYPQAPYAKTVWPNDDQGWQEILAIADPEITADWVIAAAKSVLASSIQQAFQGIIDFNDQLYMPVVFAANIPKFSIVFVDEAQDLNALQHKLVEKAVDYNGRLIAVGDPRQAIYGWRGALTDSLDQLERKFDAKVMPLSVCFRCGKKIVAEARKVFPEIDIFEDAPDGEVTHTAYLDVEDLIAGDLVICRNNAPLIKKAYQAIRKGIGVKLLGRDIEKGIVAILKKVVPGGENNFPNVTWEAIAPKLVEWKTNQLEIAENNKRYAQMETIRDKYECLQMVKSATGNSATLASAVKFLRELFDQDGPITLATVHKAKGLEYDTVWYLKPNLIPNRYLLKTQLEAEADISDALTDNMPDDYLRPLQLRLDHANDLLEQEYNIDYVARTRAKSRLIYCDEE